MEIPISPWVSLIETFWMVSCASHRTSRVVRGTTVEAKTRIRIIAHGSVKTEKASSKY